MDYMKLYDELQYNREYTSRDGYAPATLSAMARRGLLECLGGKPQRYVKKRCVFSQIDEILKREGNPEFFVLFSKGEKLGMMCSIKNNTVIDCYGKTYDLSKVYKLKTFPPVKYFDLD